MPFAFHPSVRSALVCAFALVLATSTGCISRRRKLDQPHAGRPLQTATLEQLTDTLRQRHAAIETLNAAVDLEPSLISPGKGEITDYKDVRGYILMRKPAWIRVIALYPVVRGTAFEMVSDGETFRVHLPIRNSFLMGSNRIEKPSPKKLENLRPQHLLEALLIRPPEQTEQAALENWSEGAAAHYIVHVLRRDKGARLLLARKIWFDRVSLEIARQQIFDAAGDPVTDARYRDWERTSGVTFPREVVISRPKDEYELAIRFRKTTFNEPMSDDKFELPIPSGAKVERVAAEKTN